MESENKGDGWRVALEKAWDSSATDSDKTEFTTEAPQAAESNASTSEVAEPTEEASSTEAPIEAQSTKTPSERDEKGKFLPRAAQKTETKPPAPAKPDAKTGTPAPKTGETSSTKPPAGWKQTEREAWASVPPAAQAAIARREREIAIAMQEAAPHRQTAQAFEALAAPYMGLIKSQGGDVMATAENLFQTYGALHMAPPAHKAALVANVIQTFGVDPAMVAAHLQGQHVPQQPQGFDPNQLAQSIEQRISSRLEQQQAAVIARHHEKRLAEFEASHEFVDDLREPMAKLIGAGLANDFEDAYAKASSMDPDVSAAMRQREEAKQANAARASTQRARAASSSLKSSPAGGTGAAQPRSLRDILEAKFDELSGSRR